MEYEVRFYYPTAELNELITKLSENDDLEMGLRTYEKTVQFNHCDPIYDFYSKEIDGRFRVRISSNVEETKCKFESFNVMCLGSRNNPKTIARSLFDAFRKCDDLGYEVAVMEAVEEDGIGMAIMNRARRAAKKW